ncbi:hypothetical protein HYDPIDRAFT_30141 [Hydnomerulius pinastri MD-312]|uniref:Acyl-CoA thioesterase-like N-terminal HotDog domain-containing protein n=1 Tax=Hydnomerulius pinastri MD-312 TaxID=994086 RepID=A0A0C9W6I7_9AGAM|nr:hypothetical protein HYDPIDRAFT_30141 [Hydnomerulius pinastri MD-312]
MAPLAKALEVAFLSRGDDGRSVYRCELDRGWRVGAVPQGGYSLGTVIEACIEHQSRSSHIDPIHVSAHFLRATNAGAGEVYIRVLKTGKTFTNLLADLVQQGTTKITAHLIFGDLSPPPSDQERKILSPPSPYARRLPIHHHPSAVSPDPTQPAWSRQMQMQMSTDREILNHNHPDSATRTTSQTIGGGGTEWGAWCELTDKRDKIKPSSISFFADTFTNLPMLLPESDPNSAGPIRRWFPTITMTVEFKARIPSSKGFSDRTVGLYSESRFLNDPQARHNARVEVWTAPSQIGQGEPVEGWREKQFCIAVADQMALMLPMELNMREGKRDATKL